MKFFKYAGHPVLVICLYLLLLIESEHFGGFYLLYLLMALPAGSSFAIVAIVGILSLFIGYKISRKGWDLVKSVLFLLGFSLMIFSLILFFSQKDRQETFHLAIPILTFVLFGICSLCFLVNTFSLLLKSTERKDKKLKMIA